MYENFKIDAGLIAINIESYPSLDDENSTYNYTRKKEIYDLRLDAGEIPQNGELLKSQKLMKIFLSPHTPNTRVLVYQGLGVGKTCLSSAIVELYKNYKLENNMPKTPALIMLKNNTLIRNYISEIANVCTHDVYKAKIDKEGITKEIEQNRIKRQIQQVYNFVTFETFLKNLPPDSFIKERYSNRIIIVDEVHNLRENTSKKRTTGKKGKVDEEGENTGGKLTKVDIKKIYDNLHHFLHTVENCRIMILTGTPIWDKTSEIATVMNLLLPEDDQLPTGKEFDKHFFNKEGKLKNIDELKDAFHGKISYLRQMLSTARKIEYGTTKPFAKHITLYPSIMSDFQKQYLFEATQKTEKKTITVKGKKVERETKGGAVYSTAISASIIVFPVFDAQGNVIGGDYGKEIFKKYAYNKKTYTKKGENGKEDKTTDVVNYEFNNNFIRKEFEDINKLRIYSSKIASIVEYVLAYPNELIFIFTGENVADSPGAILIALILKLYGLTWAKTDADIKKSRDILPSTGKPGRRFAVITSNPQTTNEDKPIELLLKSINNENNKYGQRCQVLIGSEKIAQGISLSNFRQVHILSPHWNIPYIDQAMGRIYRFMRHNDLLPEERYIRIFRHIAVESGTIPTMVKVPSPIGGELIEEKEYNVSVNQTIDLYIYDTAEAKDYKNTQIYRLMKEEAFDCAIAYDRNVLEQDVDGTRECDYEACNYECSNMPPSTKFKARNTELGINSDKKFTYKISKAAIDTSTWLKLYSESAIQKIGITIKRIYQTVFSVSFNDLYIILSKQHKELSENLLLKTLHYFIYQRVPIKNLYGFDCYLKEDSDIYFLDNTLEIDSKYSNSTYVEYPLLNEAVSMENIIEIEELEHDMLKIKQNCVVRGAAKTFKFSLKQYSYFSQIILFETIYSLYFNIKKQVFEYPKNKKIAEIAKALCNLYLNKVYQMQDGTRVHVLKTEEYKGISYDVSAKAVLTSGKMKYFDETETAPFKNKWKYIGSVEKEEKYIKEIKEITSKSKFDNDEFKDNQYGIYGYISLKDKSFRIVTKEENKKNSRGFTCKTINDLGRIYDIFFNIIKYLPPPSKASQIYTSKDEIIDSLKNRIGIEPYIEGIEDEPLEKIQSIYTLLAMKKETLCTTLKKWFKANNLLFTK
jgi:hypothetical protein